MEKVDKITVTLSNGMSVRIPAKNWRETVAEMEKNLAKENKDKKGK